MERKELVTEVEKHLDAIRELIDLRGANGAPLLQRSTFNKIIELVHEVDSNVRYY
jgi:hypothetical protein